MEGARTATRRPAAAPRQGCNGVRAHDETDFARLDVFGVERRPGVAHVAGVEGTLRFGVVRESLFYMPCAPTRAGTIRVLDLATRRDLLWAVVPDVSLVPNAESAYLWNLAISPDGRSLLYDTPVNFHANLWMLENFR